MTEEAKIIEELRKENASLRVENALLRQKVDLLVRRIFGRGSEVMSPDQLELLLGGSEGGTPLGKGDASLEEEAELPGKKKARRNPRERWPSDLPVVDEILDPQEVKEAPHAWRLIGAEVSEQLDYEPAKFMRRRLIRNKYVSGKISIAPRWWRSCRRRSRSAALRHRDSWPPSSWASTATICRSTGRRASF